MKNLEHVKYFFLFIAGIIALVYLIAPWKHTKSKRKSDKIRLRGHQKRIYGQVKKLISEGNIVTAAQLLESLRMYREAINVLEKGKYIKEAAGVLLRIHAPNRAAIIYAKYGMWENAANCFELAKMYSEAAKCAKEYGDMNRALKNYLKIESYEEAAGCYIALGNFRAAAQSYINLNKEQEALILYHKQIEESLDGSKLLFDESEVNLFVDYVKKGNVKNRFVEVLAEKERLVDIIIQFVKENKLPEAADLYLRARGDVASVLIGMGHFAEEENARLALLFEDVSNYEYAGIIYERIAEFEKAAEAFKKHEDFERALYCYERAGKKEEVQEMRCRLASEAGRSPKQFMQDSSTNQNPFKLEDTKNDHGKSKEGQNRTIDTNHDIPPPPRPMVPTNDVNTYSDTDDVVQFPAIPSLGNDELGDNDCTQVISGVPSAIPINPPANGLLDHHKSTFHKIELLQELDFNQKNMVWDLTRKMIYKQGEIIVECGSEPMGVYFIVRGKVSYHKERLGKIVKIDEVKAPTILGEFWLLIDKPAEVRIVAENDCEIYLVERDALNSLMDINGTIARKLYKKFTMHLVDKFLISDDKKEKMKAS